VRPPPLRRRRAPGTVRLLVTTAHSSLAEHRDPRTGSRHPNLGRLVQPRHCSSVERTAAAGIPWAADNDCFQGLDGRRYVRMLDRLAGLPGCRFVCAPDVVRCRRCRRTVDGYPSGERCTCAFSRAAPKIVVGDAALTARRFDAWAPGLERRGLPVALVLQDGLERSELAAWLRATWPRLDAVFIGGSTAWKLGPAAARFVRLALRDGKHVHWGRVNTRERFRYIASVGGHSFDGSSFARWRHAHLDNGLAWTLEPPPASGEHCHWQLRLAT
jgi:hypothetical protein